MTHTYHVSKQGSDRHLGTEDSPFLTISKAASLATAGDTVIVHKGIYREWVDPKNSGLSDLRRITYKSAENENAIIKGSEIINSWDKVEGTVWKAIVSNDLFNGFNPFSEEIFGDWLYATDPPKHLGDVYLNGMSFYETDTLEACIHATIKEEVLDTWTKKIVPAYNVEQTKYQWYAEVEEKLTTIYANFHDYDPNEELVEINVRRSCFFPTQLGINYITVSGFEMAQAATPWTPPTADQPGLIGPHWSKGWIIEDNIIHDAKTSAVSIGKEISTGHNFKSLRKDKPGYQYQLEVVFNARDIGWTKEKIGSHIIRRNTIYDCGQNGIVGHLGCIFSEIYDNHIHHIALKREFYGHEIAGIKLHAAIDTEIHNNHIHDCSLGTWLDWQTQGTRVSSNVFHHNNRDLFIEVSHGPYIVDHNVLASEYALDNLAQGGAYINNIIAGKMNHRKVLNRSTPYHRPHSTKMAGFAVVQGGDDRFYNNIFIGKESIDETGTNHYDGYPDSMTEYLENVHSKPGDLEIFLNNEQPVYINDNIYFNGALAYNREKSNLIAKDFQPHLTIRKNETEYWVEFDMPDSITELKGAIHATDSLGRARFPDSDFEDKYGQPLLLDRDFYGNKKEQRTSPELLPIN